jgi:hypothetical protein
VVKLIRPKYKLKELAYELDITETTLLELRRKLRMKTVEDEDVKRLKIVVNSIRRKYKKVTLCTINEYIRFQGVLYE